MSLFLIHVGRSRKQYCKRLVFCNSQFVFLHQRFVCFCLDWRQVHKLLHYLPGWHWIEGTPVNPGAQVQTGRW